MFWDIALPVLAAAAQVLTGFLGWRVTMDGVKPERKKLYESLFALASVIGIVCVGLAAYRGSQISNDLAQIKLGQATTNSGIQQIEKTPPTVNVNLPAPSQHTRADWQIPGLVKNSQGEIVPLTPFRKDQVPMSNIGYKNGGDFAIGGTNMKAMFVIVPNAEQKQAFFRYRKDLNKRPSATMGVLNPHTDQILYFTLFGHALSEDEVKELEHGTSGLCALAVLNWTDSTGNYDTYFSECLNAEPTGGYNWHLSPQNNEEHKVR